MSNQSKQCNCVGFVVECGCSKNDLQPNKEKKCICSLHGVDFCPVHRGENTNRTVARLISERTPTLYVRSISDLSESDAEETRAMYNVMVFERYVLGSENSILTDKIIRKTHSLQHLDCVVDVKSDGLVYLWLQVSPLQPVPVQWYQCGDVCVFIFSSFLCLYVDHVWTRQVSFFFILSSLYV